MRRILYIFSIFFVCFGYAHADWHILHPDMRNPFMGEFQNQIAFGIGQGFDQGWIVPPPSSPVPFYIGTFQYSQPTTFFRVPARRSLNVSYTLGFGESRGWQWDKFSVPLAYISEDIALFRASRFYGGFGPGVGLQAKQNNRLGAKLLFQLKIFLGFNLSRTWALEAYVQHFSNANTAEDNYSYAFYGLNATYNF